MSGRKFRLFGVINPVDVLLIAGVVLFFWQVVFSAPEYVAAQGGQRIRYTIELGNKWEGFYREIEPGIEVFDIQQGFFIGTVVSAHSLPYLQDVPDHANDIIRRVPVDGREFTYVVVEAWADVSDFGTNIGQYWIVVNRHVFVESRDFAGNGFITNLEFL